MRNNILLCWNHTQQNHFHISFIKETPDLLLYIILSTLTFTNYFNYFSWKLALSDSSPYQYSEQKKRHQLPLCATVYGAETCIEWTGNGHFPFAFFLPVHPATPLLFAPTHGQWYPEENERSTHITVANVAKTKISRYLQLEDELFPGTFSRIPHIYPK